MVKLHKKVWLWYGLALLVIGLDQLTKIWISDAMVLGQSVIFTSFFNFTLLHNEGAAFSFLSSAGGWQRYALGILALVVSVGLVVWIARIAAGKLWEPAALALVLGGALGNLIDRTLHGYVVDFIVVHYQQHAWPAFNVADMAISAGAIMLVIDAFRSRHKAGEESTESLNKQ
ncbi:signal peptidase II [Halioxenophilus sp. WMMB6]|uniref:signal peptidase II n=1 Tax=Halioxenophilus sp. WMMB6 TaxID=3073815 RepID=UPI00295E48A0|nr:signal peptidase II [Halioxenophilus sp. WMMB6]